MSAEIIHGDCIDVMRGMPDASVDAVVADPPYNVGMGYESHDDRMDPAEYERWCADWYAESRRVAKRAVIFPGHGNLAMWHRIAKPSGVGCWYKPGNPARGGVFQFCEWEPFLLYGGRMSKSDVIRATVSRQKGVGKHPCPKPLGLIEEVVRRLRATSVLDPFLGSGTTGVACVNLGVPFTGIEKCATYATDASQRIADAQAQMLLGVA
jgi:site-specific DNA-methyltransferase (adenine-specific)